MISELTRMLATSRKPGAGLALPPPLVPVGVRGVREVMPPVAFCLTCIDSRERLTARPVAPVVDSFPVRRVLAGAMLAGVAAMAFWGAVVAGVVDCLTRLQRSLELPESVAVRGHRATLAVLELPVILLAAMACPWPAVIRTALVYVGGISLKPCHAPAERAAQYARPPQLVIVPPAQPLRERGLVTFAARSSHALVAGFKRIPVLHEPLVVSDTQSPDVRRSLAVLTIRHSTIIARSAYEGVVPALCQALTRV